MSELATAVVRKLERLDTPSAAVLRRALYDVMGSFGINVRDIALEERRLRGEELRQRALRSQRSLEKMQSWADRLPALQTVVFGVKPSQELLDLVERVRAMLAEENAVVAEIAVALSVDRSFVLAVRNLDYARGCQRDLTAKRKAMPRKHRNRLAAFMARTQGWTPAPTQERIKQEDGEPPIERVVAGGGRSHQFVWPIDAVRHLLDDAEYMAAQRFRDAYDGAQAASRASGFDGGGGGSNPASKLALTPHQEHCCREFEWFRKRLPAFFRNVATNFVLNLPLRGQERALGRVGYGQRLYRNPELGDHQARGASDGAIVACCAFLAYLSKQLDGEIKAERIKIAEFIDTQPGIKAHIRAAAAATDPDAGVASQQVAIGLVCKRTKFSRWIIRKCVLRQIELAKADKELREARRPRAAAGDAGLAA